MIREVVAAARSQPVASILTLLLVAGMCLAVLLTAGRTVGAREAVLGSIDDASSRQLVILADSTAGLSSGVVERIRGHAMVESVFGLGPATDVRNAAFEGGGRVAVRTLYQDAGNGLGLPWTQDLILSPRALADLSFILPVGSTQDDDGIIRGVGGVLPSISALEPFEPLALEVHPTTGNEDLSLLVVTAHSVGEVEPVEIFVRSVLDAQDNSGLSVRSSPAIAELRNTIEGQLGSFGAGLVAAILLTTGLLVAAVLYGLVMLRRKDYGRRRALGATRGLIIVLVLGQVLYLGIVGALTGTVAASAALAFSGDPLPPLPYLAAVDILAVTTALLAAVLPAVSAAGRDPLHELRVP